MTTGAGEPTLADRLAQAAKLLDLGEAENAAVVLAAAAAACSAPDAAHLSPSQVAEAEDLLRRCAAAETQLRTTVVSALAANGILRRASAAYGGGPKEMP